jgi:hypothetical protein
MRFQSGGARDDDRGEGKIRGAHDVAKRGEIPLDERVARGYAT